MVRGKTQMKRIENDTSRQVTFSKRRNGLFKKALELSVLCDAELAVIVFSSRGKLYEFASSSMAKTIQRYEKRIEERESGIHAATNDLQSMHLELDVVEMSKRIELLDETKRRLSGEGLESCSVEELECIENQLEKSLNKIRTTRSQLLWEQVDSLKFEEKKLFEENRRLCQKEPLVEQPQLSEVLEEENEDVETDLVIGPPKRRLLSQKHTFPLYSPPK